MTSYNRKSMLALFQDLGRAVEKAFENVHYDERRFPDISLPIVRKHDVPNKLDIAKLMHELIARGTGLETSAINPFGDPPVVVYRGRYFFIQVLFWLDSTTTIHQHSFSGTFQVLRGSSLHTIYQWKTQIRVNSRFAIGNAERVVSELLTQGDCHKIVSGEKFSHALFHLERPSVSMVVRTYSESDVLPQYIYEIPSIRIHPPEDPADFAAALKYRLLDMLKITNDPCSHSVCKQFAKTASFEDIYTMLKAWEPESPFHQILLTAFYQRFSSWAVLAAPAVAEQHRLRVLVAKRRKIVDKHHRFVLALMLNVRSRRDFVSLMQQRFPGTDPVSKVVTIIRELTSVAKDGESLLGVNFDDNALVVFEAMLRGYRGPRLLAFLSRSFDISRAQFRGLRQLETALQTSYLFSNLFAESASRTLKPRRHPQAAHAS